MKTKNKETVSILNDLIWPIIWVIATLPIMMVIGLFQTAAGSCNHMGAWHAKDYIQKNW